jgi:excisionase family DNA binding protein
MPLVSRAEAARLLGVSADAVYQAIKRGKLSVVTTVTGAVRVNSDTMLDEWRRNTQRRANGPRDLTSRTERARRDNPRPLRPAAERMNPNRSTTTPLTGAPRASQTAEHVPEYEDSRARTEHLKAELLELDRKQKLGQLISAAEVEASWSKLVTSARTKLLSIPSKAKQRLPDLDLDAINLLTDLIRESLEDLANGIDDAAETEETEDSAR